MSYSLRDALDLQDTSETANEQAEAEAAVAELMEDARQEEQEQQQQSAAAASAAAALEAAAGSPGNGSNPVVLIHSSTSGNSSSSSGEEEEVLQRTSAPSSSQQPRRGSLEKKRVPVLDGKLSFAARWDSKRHQEVFRCVITGSWRYNDESSGDANAHHTFELTSDGDADRFDEQSVPTSGSYSGWFGYSYKHVTPKGKKTTKVTKISEDGVKLDFRARPKFPGSYHITGRGKNALGGAFSVNGIAKPLEGEEASGRKVYGFLVRKTYFDPTVAASYKPRPSAAATTTQRAPSPEAVSRVGAAPAAVPSPPTSEGPTPLKVVSAPVPAVEKPAEQLAVPEVTVPPRRETLQSPERRAARSGIPVPKNGMPPPPPPPTPEKIWNAGLTQDTGGSNTPGGVDRINGRGMWHAWTRSFDTPLLALLDLFDNAVDASWTLLPEHKETNADYEKPKIRVELDRLGSNGVVMRNASRFIPPLQQVLQVYKSSKAGEGDNSIGENGIGVKHACASLSGLSLVFTKTTDPTTGACTMSMGILMQELQREDGIVLPSVAFALSDAVDNVSLDEIQEQLEDHCANFPHTWGVAVREYGGNHFGDGIDRCLHHMDELRTHRDWRDQDNVFAVVLAGLKHAAFDSSNEGDGSDEDVQVIEIDRSPARRRKSSGRRPSGVVSSSGGTTYHNVSRGGESDVDEDVQRSLSLLKTLKDQLPYLYLHLHDLDICVEGKPIESIYWERRLAELSRFELQLSQTELWSKIKKERYVHDFPQNVYDISNPEETVRFFCGFDPYRCRHQFHKDSRGKNHSGENSDDEFIMSYVPGGADGGGMSQTGNNSAIKIYLYSRQSGRLIKVQNDPRNEMGLTAGSTDFCQGMTVIVDDYNGTLPLNPTKQDTAYGHSKHGQIHAANLKEWTAAISHFYWQYHFLRFGSSKVAVTTAVSSTKTSLEDAYKNYCYNNKLEGNNINNVRFPTVTPLCKGTFITYQNIEFQVTGYHGIPKIRATKNARDSASPVVNFHEVVRLDEAMAARSKALSAQKKRSRQQNYQQNEVSSHVSSLEMADGRSFKRPRASQQSGLEQQDRLVLEGSGSYQAPIQLDGGGSRPQSPHGNNAAANLALAQENERLKRQLQEYHNNNVQLQQYMTKGNQQIKFVQNESQKLGQEVSKHLDTIRKLKEQNQKLTGYVNQQIARGNHYKAEVKRLRSMLGGNSSQSDVTRTPPMSPDPSADSSPMVEQLKKEVKIYKSRAEFYMKETQAKKKQIENLMQEKSRFEDRIHELEAAQLSVDTQHGGDLMQF